MKLSITLKKNIRFNRTIVKGEKFAHTLRLSVIIGRNLCPGPVPTTFVCLSPALSSEPAPTHPMSSDTDISSDYTGPVDSFIFQRSILLTYRLPSL